MRADRPFHVFVVCTGIICRSAAAEIVLRALVTARWGDAAPVTVASAGTGAVEDGPLHPRARAQPARRGRDTPAAEAFRGRLVEPAPVRAADLVLVATREHRATLARWYPHADARLFTLREFARLADAATADATADPAAGSPTGSGPSSRRRTRCAAIPGVATPGTPSPGVTTRCPTRCAGPPGRTGSRSTSSSSPWRRPWPPFRTACATERDYDVAVPRSWGYPITVDRS